MNRKSAFEVKNLPERSQPAVHNCPFSFTVTLQCLLSLSALSVLAAPLLSIWRPATLCRSERDYHIRTEKFVPYPAMMSRGSS